MTEANPSDRELHLEYSDPFQSPTERLGSEASMRRLVPGPLQLPAVRPGSIAARYT